ncbi:tumor necrosis factor receptor superfamily member 10B-like [Xyrauchen texanus]|uniref:tumor necrosis factor receptor superfamily member 10B-like n=1 Tax=Xyrauchen texanus TaxID=154827 RepID=UPI00224236C7|nr:tumor necrosis factor receptor superfamily member 10B-like [Xyrauchen texanus]
MVVTVLIVCMVMLTGHLMYGLPMDGRIRYPRALPGDTSLCPAGYYLSKHRCVPCSPGFFTSQKNRENSCHRCLQSCKPHFNKEVVKECTNTSDVQCRCRDGFICTGQDIFTGHCRTCEPITASTPDQSSTSVKFPSVTISTTRPHDPKRRLGVLVWILFGLISVMLSIVFLAIFLRLCRKKEKECFKQFVRKCSLVNLEMQSETTPPPNQPIEQPHAHNTDGSFHQPTSSEQAVPRPGNLGPLHIYGPQTVFVSLLNQFGWDGGEKKTHELQKETINHPQSPPAHLSEEEGSRENDFFIFPSQEQGKECHISKEEVL